MAELGELSNYQTYPGLGPWVLADFEQDYTEDYRIDDSNLPANSFALQNVILSNSYEFESDQFIGTIIPLPSAALAGASLVTTFPIVIRSRYKNWLNTGFANVITTANQVNNDGVIPAIISNQVLDKYKEVVHYGMDMIIFAVTNTLGKVTPLSVDSFIPFLEHRMQALFRTVVLVDGIVSSVGYENSRIVFKMDWGGNSVTVPKPYDGDSDVKLNIFSPHPEDYDVSHIDADGNIYVDDSELTAEELEALGAAVGNYFYLNKGIQIFDPAVLFTDARSTTYYERDLGYETREQQVSSTGTLISFLYNRQNMEDTLTTRIQFLENQSSSSSSSATSSSSTEANTETTEEQHEIYTLYDNASIEEVTKLRDYVKNAKEVFESYAEEKPESENYKLLLSALASLEDNNTYVRIDVQASRTRNHNFGAGTQQGSVFRFNDEDGRYQYYEIREHPRNETFLISNIPVGAEDPSQKEPKRIDLQEIIYDYPVSKWNINSNRMWTISDITTSTSSATASLDSGLFKGNIISTLIPGQNGTFATIQNPGGDTSSDVSQDGTIDEQEDQSLRIEYQISDADYYGYEYLYERYILDANPEGGTVKAWKKFDGWVLYRRGYEFSTGYQIEDIDALGGGKMIITISSVPEELVEGSDDYEANINSEWWIGLGERIDMQPTTLDYVGTPYLGLNAVLGETSTVVSEVLSSGTNNLIFDGIYVGTPIAYPLAEDSVVTVLSNNGAIFQLSDNAALKVSSSKSFKYIAFDEELTLDTQIVLYNRDDDVSNALYARSGQLGYLYKLEEFLVYSGKSKQVDAKVSAPSGPSNIQIITGDSDDIPIDHDIVAIYAGYNKDATPLLKGTDAEGKYDQTIWVVRHGDRLMGYESQSGIENSVYTRTLEEFTRIDVEEIPLYKLAQLFTGGELFRYLIPGNSLTGDPLVKHAEFKFQPLSKWNGIYSIISDAKFGVVEPGQVLRDVKSRTSFKYEGIGRVILVNQPQNYMDPSTNNFFGDGNSTVLNGRPTGSPGGKFPGQSYQVDFVRDDSEYGYARENTDKYPVWVDAGQDGVFLHHTNDFYSELSHGLGGTYSNDYDVPFLISRNMSNASYSVSYPHVDIAGYTKLKRDEEHLGLVFRRYNLLDLVNAKHTVTFSGSDPDPNNPDSETALFVTPAMAGVPVTKYSTDLLDGLANVNQSALTDTVVITSGGLRELGSSTTDSKLKTVEGYNFFPINHRVHFLDEGLVADPFELVSDSSHQIIIMSKINYLNYLVSMSGGDNWAYMDDISLARAKAGTATSPTAKIIGDSMHLFYFDGKIDLKYKRIPISYFTALFNRYRGKRSGDEEDDKWNKQKEELQAKLDKIESSKIVESFEQKVALSVTAKARMRIAYYSEDGKVQSATSDNQGSSWTTDTINF
jgi:hypothetical protein